jgi:hypothetical protein
MKIFINGNQIEINVKTLSYETICSFCGYSPDHYPTVTYTRSRKGETGYMYKGSVPLKLNEGIVINCTVTHNA